MRVFRRAPNAFWRHDVDFSLRAAERMARFAVMADVRSVFYLNPRSDYYNLLGREGEDAIMTILECAHGIGLHCDPHGRLAEDAVAEDLALLNAALPAPVDENRVSFHMPRSSVLWRDYDWFDSAYASHWENRYLSDSRRDFGPDKEARISDDMQINLHPEHWFS